MSVVNDKIVMFNAGNNYIFYDVVDDTLLPWDELKY